MAACDNNNDVELHEHLTKTKIFRTTLKGLMRLTYKQVVQGITMLMMIVAQILILVKMTMNLIVVAAGAELCSYSQCFSVVW